VPLPRPQSQNVRAVDVDPGRGVRGPDGAGDRRTSLDRGGHRTLTRRRERRAGALPGRAVRAGRARLRRPHPAHSPAGQGL
ncbi:MAG: hypothetical protein AVDCRST_MAG61-1225, partial [uncultured Friedmanniella sp.]